ncbi:MAG: VOC family protein [Planctomycetota bacterium]
MPTLLETILYTPDPITTARFYADVIGLRLLEEPSERMAALRVSEASVLLLFEPEWSGRPGRDVPSHGATGPGHVAFHVDDLDAWPLRLAKHGVEIEQRVTWPTGFFRAGRSIYFRDPAGNSVELLDADIWPE